MKYNISIKEQTFEIEVGEIREGMARVNVNGTDYDVRIETYPDAVMPVKEAPGPVLPKPAPAVAPAPPLTPLTPAPAVAPASPSGDNVIKAPMPGLILEVKVKPGDTVTVGMTVIIMEAMKMENSITVKIGGTVKEVHVQKGAQVMTGHPLLVIS